MIQVLFALSAVPYARPYMNSSTTVQNKNTERPRLISRRTNVPQWRNAIMWINSKNVLSGWMTIYSIVGSIELCTCNVCSGACASWGNLSHVKRLSPQLLSNWYRRDGVKTFGYLECSYQGSYCSLIGYCSSGTNECCTRTSHKLKFICRKKERNTWILKRTILRPWKHALINSCLKRNERVILITWEKHNNEKF